MKISLFYNKKKFDFLFLRFVSILYHMNISKMTENISEEVLQYSLSTILSLKSFNCPILEESTLSFLDFYNKLEIKQPSINFNNNRKKSGFTNRKNDWKSKNKFSSKETIMFLKNTWKPKLADNDEDNIRNKVMKSLNKLNETKFTIITKELLEDMEKIEYIELLHILIESILEKIVFDEKFQLLYAKLCNELSVNKKWQKNLISIIEKDDDFFYSYNSLAKTDHEIFGPFSSKEECAKDAMDKIDFQKTLVDKVQDKFKNIPSELERMRNLENDEAKICIKKEIFSLVGFIFNLVSTGFIHEYVIYHCISKLLGMEKIETPYDEEIEAAIKIINLMQSSKSFKMSVKNYNSYKEYVQNTLVLKIRSIRMKFLLEECFNIKLNNANINGSIDDETDMNVKKSNNNSAKNDNENINSLISEFKQSFDENLINEYYDLIIDKNRIFYIWFDDLIKGNLYENWNVFFNNIDMKLKLSFSGYLDIIKDIVKDFPEISIDYPDYMSNFIKIMRFVANETEIDDVKIELKKYMESVLEDDLILMDFNGEIENRD
jgi:hypothetical protein